MTCPCTFPDCNGSIDYVIDQGADWIETITLLTPTGTPVDLTGCSAVLQARPYPGFPTAKISLSTAASTLTLGGTLGTVVPTLPGVVTAALTPALNVPVGVQETDTLAFLSYYDLVVTSSTGAITAYQHGKLLLLLGISNIARTDGEIVLPVYP